MSGSRVMSGDLECFVKKYRMSCSCSQRTRHPGVVDIRETTAKTFFCKSEYWSAWARVVG